MQFKRSSVLKLCSKCLQRRHNSWTASSVRKSFLQYFREKEHVDVQSSSVAPQDGDNLFFVNAGMNQFKPIFLNTLDETSPLYGLKRACNSQKCIRVGGKHNDLEDVGRDTLHHTFFEMLGSWSFGDYFKQEACSMALKLFTEVYGLPMHHLYFTYFQGDAAMGWKPDTETKDIWLSLGVHPSKIIASSARDNFWDMGDTGPCGPCTEIHYDQFGRPNVSHLVNNGVSSVLELWNIVFMQFNRLSDGTLQRLPKKHVDTGIGFERLVAALQNKVSNYDTDLFIPIFSAIEKTSKASPYGGRLGRSDVTGHDTAYRVVADHLRMLAVSMTDGLLPSASDRGRRVRNVAHRAFHQYFDVLGGKRGTFSSLIWSVAETLGDAFPELQNLDEVVHALEVEEDLYFGLVDSAVKTVRIAATKINNVFASDSFLSDLHNGWKYGPPLPIDLLLRVCQGQGLITDEQGLTKLLEERAELELKQKMERKEMGEKSFNWQLKDADLNYLRSQEIAETDTSYKYDYTVNNGQLDVPSLRARIAFIKTKSGSVSNITTSNTDECMLILDKTNFYSKVGGQQADRGFMLSQTGQKCTVDYVQNVKGYIAHLVTEMPPNCALNVGDEVILHVDEDVRHACMKHHTATHLLGQAAREHFGQFRLFECTVKEDRLTLKFTCGKKKISTKDLVAMETRVNELINESIPVHTEETEFLKVAQNDDVMKREGSVYPSMVRVVNIEGASGRSVELCCGTHVRSTSELQAFYIRRSDRYKGVLELSASTGNIAKEAIIKGRNLVLKGKELERLNVEDDKAELVYLFKDIKSKLKLKEDLPKGVWEDLHKSIDPIWRKIKHLHTSDRIEDAKKVVTEALRSNKKDSCVVSLARRVTSDFYLAAAATAVDRPIVFVNLDKNIDIIFCIPQRYSEDYASNWVSEVLQRASLASLSALQPYFRPNATVLSRVFVVREDFSNVADVAKPKEIRQLLNDAIVSDQVWKCDVANVSDS